MSAPWTYREEEHLGALAYSLFDPAGERSAVGLIRWDAERICRAMNTGPDLLEALKIAAQLAEQILHGDATPYAGAKLIADNSRAIIAKTTGDAS